LSLTPKLGRRGRFAKVSLYAHTLFNNTQDLFKLRTPDKKRKKTIKDKAGKYAAHESEKKG